VVPKNSYMISDLCQIYNSCVMFCWVIIRSSVAFSVAISLSSRCRKSIFGIIKWFREGLFHHLLCLFFDGGEHGMRKVSFPKAGNDAHCYFIVAFLHYFEGGRYNGAGI